MCTLLSRSIVHTGSGFLSLACFRRSLLLHPVYVCTYMSTMHYVRMPKKQGGKATQGGPGYIRYIHDALKNTVTSCHLAAVIPGPQSYGTIHPWPP